MFPGSSPRLTREVMPKRNELNCGAKVGQTLSESKWVGTLRAIRFVWLGLGRSADFQSAGLEKHSAPANRATPPAGWKHCDTGDWKSEMESGACGDKFVG